MRPYEGRIAGCSIILLILLVAGLAGADQLRAYRIRDGAEIDFGRAVVELSQSSLIFVGELHDSAAHHRLQLDIIRALHELDLPIAVGLEMFPAEKQAVLDKWVNGAIGEEEFKAFYLKEWKLSWQLYRDIFLYVREHEIPLIGLNLPREVTQKVARSGFASLSPEELKKLPPGISCRVDDRYMDFIRRAYGAHGRGGREFTHFCEAQLLWDKGMAWNLAEFLKRNAGRKVVVLTGMGHAWKKGIPEQAAGLISDARSAVVLPIIPGQVQPGNATAGDADYLMYP